MSTFPAGEVSGRGIDVACPCYARMVRVSAGAWLQLPLSGYAHTSRPEVEPAPLFCCRAHQYLPAMAKNDFPTTVTDPRPGKSGDTVTAVGDSAGQVCGPDSELLRCPFRGAFRAAESFVSHDGREWVAAEIRSIPDLAAGWEVSGNGCRSEGDGWAEGPVWHFYDVRPVEAGEGEAVYSGMVYVDAGGGAAGVEQSKAGSGRPFSYYPGEGMLTVDNSTYWPYGAVNRYEDFVYLVRPVPGGVEIRSHPGQWSQDVYIKWVLLAIL